MWRTPHIWAFFRHSHSILCVARAVGNLMDGKAYDVLRTAQDNDQVSSPTTFNLGRDERVFVNICQAFANFRDYRGRTAKHPLFGLLMILLLSRIAGCRGWDATADWAAMHDDLFRRHLDLWKTPPGADTLRRTAEGQKSGQSQRVDYAGETSRTNI